MSSQGADDVRDGPLKPQIALATLLLVGAKCCRLEVFRQVPTLQTPLAEAEWGKFCAHTEISKLDLKIQPLRTA
jgi:hypothetical protein